MNNEKFETEVIEILYGERHEDIAKIAERHGVALSEATDYFNQVKKIGMHFKSLPVEEASRISLNKITAYAYEEKQPAFLGLFKFFNQPAFAAAFATALLLVGVVFWQQSPISHQRVVASKNQPVVSVAKNTDATASLDYQRVINRLLKTPMDKDSYEPLGSVTPSPRFLVGGVSTVSLSSSTATDNDFINDSVMNRIEQNVADTDALRTLFFRARKLEKLGQYQDALHDYLVIAQNTQNFEHEQSVHFSIANCYAKLGDSKTAVMVLESYQKSYGQSEELAQYIDDLKSETF